jgi:hypothetical protein
MTRFSKLSMDDAGNIVETNVREIKQSDMLKCPFCIMVAEHYHEDGRCRCDDPTHSEMKEWGYKWNGFHWIAPEEEED